MSLDVGMDLDSRENGLGMALDESKSWDVGYCLILLEDM